MHSLSRSWTYRIFIVFSALVLIASEKAALADSSTEAMDQRIGSGNPALGKQRVQSENCRECHGEDGISTAVYVPKLAGQYSQYIVKQLQDFQSGARKHPIMNVMVEGLSEDDLADIGSYFASNKIMQGDGTGENETAKNIFSRGDITRNILPCKSCHGENGKGKYSDTEIHPIIGGQHRVYLREQLRNWRSGVRANSPNGEMNVIAKSLSDTEIEALSDYISGL